MNSVWTFLHDPTVAHYLLGLGLAIFAYVTRKSARWTAISREASAVVAAIAAAQAAKGASLTTGELARAALDQLEEDVGANPAIKGLLKPGERERIAPLVTSLANRALGNLPNGHVKL